MSQFPQSIRTKIYDYCKKYTDDCDGNNNEDIATNGELEVIRQRIPYCKIVFDVGAHVGEWTRLVLKYNPQAEIHCFEPSAFTFERLLSKNFPHNVLCNHFGLSSQTGVGRLQIFKEGNGMNSLYRRDGLQDRGIAVQEKQEAVSLKTLDGYCEEKNIQAVDFLKIDVEGHELEVLRGAERMLKGGRIGIIQFEYGGCNIDSRVFLKDLFDAFMGLPYEFYKIHPRELLHVGKYCQKFENFEYSNWLAIQKRDKPSES